MISAAPEPRKLSAIDWLIIFVAIIGFAFDIYELLMMPLIAGPALAELLKVPRGDPQILKWIGRIFWISAMCGGFFGLLGGWLTDRLGRRRVLTWSILIYSFSALAAAFATSAPMLLFFRCTTFIGVCVEFVAAVAWLAELFPNPKQREKILGYTQAFSSVGGLMVTGASMFAVKYAASLPAIYGGHASWRYTLISGLIPAIPLLLIRPFLP
ncbi:MAG: MFS transporter, partial [Verrucomicrobiota bacterium]|nr:MFS transporter [Verrucomicrobiota bacterium]